MDKVESARKMAQYKIYLLTCWQEQDEVVGITTWRFRLEIPRSGQQNLFTSFKEVISSIEADLNDLSS